MWYAISLKRGWRRWERNCIILLLDPSPHLIWNQRNTKCLPSIWHQVKCKMFATSCQFAISKWQSLLQRRTSAWSLLRHHLSLLSNNVWLVSLKMEFLLKNTNKSVRLHSKETENWMKLGPCWFTSQVKRGQLQGHECYRKWSSQIGNGTYAIWWHFHWNTDVGETQHPTMCSFLCSFARAKCFTGEKHIHIKKRKRYKNVRIICREQ